MNIPTPVFQIEDDIVVNNTTDDVVDVGNPAALDLLNGTFSMAFNANDVSGRSTLFSKDGNGLEDGGHITAWIIDGEIVVRQQSAGKSEKLKIEDVDIVEGQTYHLSVSFGEDGLKLYLNGELAAAEPEFKQGIDANERGLLVGGNGWHRFSDDESPINPFDGVISNFQVYDEQLDPQQMAGVAGMTDPAFETEALASLAVENLMPALAQLHHATNTLKELASDNGFNHNGELTSGIEIQEGTGGDDMIADGDGDSAINGEFGDDVIEGNGGVDVLQGDYGNDTLNGGSGNDVLDGGHGEDVLFGGDGDDFLISQADGREGEVTFDSDRDEGIDEYSADQLTGKVYLDQPIAANDVLTGGAGADTFYFQTLINAKSIFIEEHTNDDGSIRWHDVAGENRNIHDHWVDVIGDDVITDYNRDEGDQIVIEGHTTEIRAIVYEDTDGDGVDDQSVIHLYSDQGRGGGAHNDDLLGTITVQNAIVTENEIEHSAKPAYGIVATIDGLNEAISPLEAPQIAEGEQPPIAEEEPPVAEEEPPVAEEEPPVAEEEPPVAEEEPPAAEEVEPPVAEEEPPVAEEEPPLEEPEQPQPEVAQAVLEVDGTSMFNGLPGDTLSFLPDEDLKLGEGTIAFSFMPDQITGRDAIFTKDARGHNDGDISVFVRENGNLIVRLQDEDGVTRLKAKDAANEGEETDIAITFGEEGVFLFVNGELADSDVGNDFNLAANDEYLLLGANGARNLSGEADIAKHFFDGQISDFTILDAQLEAEQVAALAQVESNVAMLA